jgi:hypothetical protein
MTPIKPAIRTLSEGDHKGLRPALAAASYEPGYQDPQRGRPQGSPPHIHSTPAPTMTPRWLLAGPILYRRCYESYTVRVAMSSL